MNRQRRLWLQRTAALGGAMLAPWQAGCGAEPPLTIAYHPWPGYAPLKLADSLGWWGDGLLRSLPTGSASASRAALAEGRAQAAALTLDEVLQAVADGLPLRVVALFSLSHGADVVLARPSFAARARWPGARLGHEAGAVGELMTASWLEFAGLRAGQLRMVNLPVDRHEQAWHDDQVDLLATSEPVAGRLETAGAVRLFDSRQLPPQRPIVHALAVHAAAARRSPRQLRRLLRELLKAQSHLLSLPVDASYRLAPWLDIPRMRVMRNFGDLRLMRWDDNRHWLIGSPAPLHGTAQELVAFLQRAGLRADARVPAALVSGDWLPAEDPG